MRGLLLPVLVLAACSQGGAGESVDLQALDAGHPDLGAPTDGPTGQQPDWVRAGTYLASLFDPAVSLCREFPGATVYWTSHDNALAARAFGYLPTPDVTHRDAILAKLQSLKICGCADVPGHDAFLNHHIDPVVHQAAQVSLDPSSDCKLKPQLVPGPMAQCGGPGALCPQQDIRHEDHPQGGWSSDMCHAGCLTLSLAAWDDAGQGKGYADLLALQILNLRNRKMPTAAMWQNLVGKWDGKGMNDAATASDGNYATYKLALLKICARVLGQPLPAGVDAKLIEAQNSAGGFRTLYDLKGGFSLDQAGNCETTSFVILAFNKPVADF